MQGIKSGAAGGGGGESPVVLLFSQTLTADAAQVNIDLSAIDMSRFLELRLVVGNANSTYTGSNSDSLWLTINGQGSGYYKNGTGSTNGFYVATPVKSHGTGASCSILRLIDCASSAVYGSTDYISFSNLYSDQGVTYSNNHYICWTGGSMADIASMKLALSSGSITAGTRVALYGYRM